MGSQNLHTSYGQSPTKCIWRHHCYDLRYTGHSRNQYKGEHNSLNVIPREVFQTIVQNFAQYIVLFWFEDIG